MTAASTRSATASGGSPGARAQQLRQLGSPNTLAPAPAHLGDAVGVEQQHFAGPELDGDVVELRLDVGPQQRAEPPDRLDAPVGMHHERQRVPAARQLDLEAAGADPQVRVRDRAEAPSVPPRSALCRSASTPLGRCS